MKTVPQSFLNTELQKDHFPEADTTTQNSRTELFCCSLLACRIKALRKPQSKNIRLLSDEEVSHTAEALRDMPTTIFPVRGKYFLSKRR